MSGAMSAVCWNCWGLRNPCTVKALQKLILEEDPTLVFLMETKFVVSEMARIKRKLDRQQGLVVPSVRHERGFSTPMEKLYESGCLNLFTLTY